MAAAPGAVLRQDSDTRTLASEDTFSTVTIHSRPVSVNSGALSTDVGGRVEFGSGGSDGGGPLQVSMMTDPSQNPPPR